MANKVVDLRKLRSELKGTAIMADAVATPNPAAKMAAAETPAPAMPATESPFFTTLVEWDALEFEPDVSKVLGLLGSGALLVLAGIVTLFFKNWLLAVFLLIAGGLVGSYAFRPPRRMAMAVTSRGVKIADRLYEFDDLQSFWISYDPPFSKELILQSKKVLVPHLKLPLGALDPLRLREILLRFLKEQKHEDSVIDIVGKQIGF